MSVFCAVFNVRIRDETGRSSLGRVLAFKALLHLSLLLCFPNDSKITTMSHSSTQNMYIKWFLVVLLLDTLYFSVLQLVFNVDSKNIKNNGYKVSVIVNSSLLNQLYLLKGIAEASLSLPKLH